ncbi:MAG: sodium-dependent transporter, partial [Myxococcales bacterium]|nr:sodium-dependent transporter [Myxococcales bacterium]
MANAPREQWTSRTGFVLAAIGSAVGLGNMWRFSYLTAEKGGAAFVVLYLLFTAAVGVPVMLAELAIGRGSQRSPIAALAHYGGPAWRPLGALFVASGFVILAYYGVIAGWTVRYAGLALVGALPDAPGAYFERISQGWPAFGFHVAFMAATTLVVSGGVKAGIERAAEVMMPALFAIVAGIAIYAATLDGASAGYAYYLNVDFANVLDWDVVAAAAGQAFFSLSLGMGAMLTFASYLGRDHDLPSESLMIASADFGVAFLAGFMVFPLIFALGLQGDVMGQDTGTVGALFIALPKAFAEMGAAGRVVGFAFFVALIVGALTSAISLLEVVVAAAMDGLGASRPRAAVVAGALITALGGLAAWRIDVLDAMDTVANNLFLVGGGLGLSLFCGYAMRDARAEALSGSRGGRWTWAWMPLLRFVVPVVLLTVLAVSIDDTVAKV